MPGKFPVCREDDARFNYLRESTDASDDLLTRDLFRSTTNRPVPIPIQRTFSLQQGRGKIEPLSSTVQQVHK